MSTTILTEAEIIAIGKQAGAAESGVNGYVLPIAFARAIEQAVLQSPEVQAWKRDAELGQCAMRFVDRAGDYCKEDPAERICDQFSAAMADIVDRHGAMRGMPSGRYVINGDLK